LVKANGLGWCVAREGVLVQLNLFIFGQPPIGLLAAAGFLSFLFASAKTNDRGLAAAAMNVFVRTAGLS